MHAKVVTYYILVKMAIQVITNEKMHYVSYELIQEWLHDNNNTVTKSHKLYPTMKAELNFSKDWFINLSGEYERDMQFFAIVRNSACEIVASKLFQFSAGIKSSYGFGKHVVSSNKVTVTIHVVDTEDVSFASKTALACDDLIKSTLVNQKKTIEKLTNMQLVSIISRAEYDKLTDQVKHIDMNVLFALAQFGDTDEMIQVKKHRDHIADLLDNLEPWIIIKECMNVRKEDSKVILQRIANDLTKQELVTENSDQIIV